MGMGVEPKSSSRSRKVSSSAKCKGAYSARSTGKGTGVVSPLVATQAGITSSIFAIGAGVAVVVFAAWVVVVKRRVTRHVTDEGDYEVKPPHYMAGHVLFANSTTHFYPAQAGTIGAFVP